MSKYYSTISEDTKKEIEDFLRDNNKEVLGYWIYREAQNLACKADKEMFDSVNDFHNDFDKVIEEYKQKEFEYKCQGREIFDFTDINKKLEDLYSNLCIDQESTKLIEKLRNKKYENRIDVKNSK